jgi:predicted PurR-regulated permease PerM
VTSPPGISEHPETPEDGGPRSASPGERVVSLSARSVFVGVGVVVGIAAGVGFLILAHAGLTLVAIALFLALALNPSVEFFVRRGLGRAAAVLAVSVLAVIIIGLVGLVLIPPLVAQIGEFVRALPGLVGDLTKGRGPLGFLERRYQIVEQVRAATSGPGLTKLSGQAGPALGVVKGVASTLVGAIVIAFLTLFMLLEGPEWRRRSIQLAPERRRLLLERVGAGIYRTVGGFVTGNLVASFLAGVVAMVIMLVAGVPYAFPLGLFVAIIELVPYIGPVVATVLVTAIALTQGAGTALVVFLLLLVYHVIEGHTLRPLIYGRAVQLSPLAVLIAILLGTEIAGILGALAAIPVAGAIQVVLAELLDQRDGGEPAGAPG